MARIYLDYASQTSIDRIVQKEMRKFSNPKYGNPSSIYTEGVSAKKALKDGRDRVADFIHAHSDEIYFTSGGTESNALAIDGAGRIARMSGIEKPHLIISNIEHSSVLETANMLEKFGFEVTRLPVDENGIISLLDLKKAIKSSTYMVSIMAVNNEIGSVQPLKEIAKVIRDFRKSSHSSGIENKYPLFHSDAAQAIHLDLNMEKLGIDLLTLDGGKVYGPRGIGALYIRRGTPIGPIICGGGQEKGMRSGTENIPAIMGFAKALELVNKDRDGEVSRIALLREQFILGLKKINPKIQVNGGEDFSIEKKSPHILNVNIPDIDNEFFVLQLDAKGISCSTKSSCLRDEDESHVLVAIGAESNHSIRFSFGRQTTKREVNKALSTIRGILANK